MAGQPNNIQYELSSVIGMFQDEDQHSKDPYEPWTTREVAEELGSTRRTALTKLKSLERRGQIASKPVGKQGGGHVWWWPRSARIGGELTDPAVLDAKIQQLDLPGEGEILESRREAVRSAYNYLQEQRAARAGEIKGRVYTSNDGGYANETTLWRNCLRPGLKQLGLETPKRGGPWRLMNDDPTQSDLFEDY